MYCFTGKDILVHPVTEEGATSVTAYLPGKDEVSAIIAAFRHLVVLFIVACPKPLYNMALMSVFYLFSGLV